MASAGESHAAPYAYIATYDDGSVSVVDLAQNPVSSVATIAVGEHPVGLAIAPNGRRVFVANAGSRSVSVIDTPTDKVMSTIPLTGLPFGLAASRDGYLYVVESGASGSVAVINAATGAKEKDIQVGKSPRSIAFAGNGKAYVTNALSNSVSVIGNSDYPAPRNPITDQSNVQDPHEIASIAVGQLPTGVTANDALQRIYVANSGSNDVTVIDAYTDKVIATVPVGRGAVDLAATPNGKFVYVCNKDDNSVSVIDASSNKVVATLDVGVPQSVSISPDGARAYVVNSGAHTIAVIDTATNKPVTVFGTGGKPTAIGISRTPVFAYAIGSGGLMVLDTSTNKIDATIKLPFDGRRRFDSGQNIAIPKDGKQVFLAEARKIVAVDVKRAAVESLQLNEGVMQGEGSLVVTRDGQQILISIRDHSQEVPALAAIDTKTGDVRKKSYYPIATPGSLSPSIAMTPDEKYVYSAGPGDPIYKFDRSTLEIGAEIPGDYSSIAISADGKWGYALQGNPGNIVVIDLALQLHFNVNSDSMGHHDSVGDHGNVGSFDRDDAGVVGVVAA